MSKKQRLAPRASKVNPSKINKSSDSALVCLWAKRRRRGSAMMKSLLFELQRAAAELCVFYVRG